MSTLNRFATTLLVMSLTAALAGCQHVSISGSKGAANKPGILPSNSPGILPQPAPSPAPSPPSASPQPAPAPLPIPNLAGPWQMGFEYNGNVKHAHFELKQDGSQFGGEGSDDESGKNFRIEGGQTDGQQIVFYKKYAGSHAAVEYSGSLEMISEAGKQLPYASGQYLASNKGREVRGAWQAQMLGEAGSQGGSKPGPPDKPPHLSGKWDVGYEYNFKTIHSTMYLEQDNGTLKGHGIDLNTKEKFVIEKGWYHFPRVTIIRRYKKDKGASSNRTMTFKAEVQVISEPNYQGPYMSGKTDGGGNWESQMLR